LTQICVLGVCFLGTVGIFQQRCWRLGIPLKPLSPVGKCCSGRRSTFGVRLILVTREFVWLFVLMFGK